MRAKRVIVLGAVGILLSLSSVMPVSAHGHHGRRTVSAVEREYLCAVCTENGCEKKGWHIHDDSIYCGYGHEDGYCDGSCDTARVCTEEQCIETGYHIHDGQYYCSYDHESGYCDGTCDSVAVCEVDGCEKTGRHTHDGTIYCGYDHSGVYCDRSCEKSESTGVRRYGRHHGCH